MLEDFLIKYKLLEEFEIELSNKESFTNQLNMMVGDGFYHPIFFIFDTFFKSSTRYIGYIGDNDFKIRDRFDGENISDIKNILVRGEFRNFKNKTKLKVTLRGMSNFQLLIHLVILIIYSILILLSILELMIPPLPNSTIIFESYLLPVFFLTLFTFCFTFVPYNIAKNVLQHGL